LLYTYSLSFAVFSYLALKSETVWEIMSRN